MPLQAREHAMRQLLMEISVAGACLSAFFGLYWLAVAFGIAAMAAGRISRQMSVTVKRWTSCGKSPSSLS